MSRSRKPDPTAVYLRISSDRLGLELGVDRQRDECRELAARRGWPDLAEFADNDIGAYTGRLRPGYRALMAAVERGEVARVIVWHPSRLWRNRTERAAGIEAMKKHRVSLVCVKGPELDLATAYGRGVADLVGSFDELESAVKSERLQAWVRQRARDGKPHGPRLYAYSRDGMTLVEREAARVPTWFEQLLAGRSITALARDAGVHHSVMRHRLLNPRYAGLRILDGQELPGLWPPLVSVDTWRAAVALLRDPGRSTNGGEVARKWLGSGLYACLRCDRPVYGAHMRDQRHSDPAGYMTYRCKTHAGRVGCWRTWRQVQTDAYVVALVDERLSRPDLADLLPVDRPDLDKLRREAQGIRRRLERLPSEYVLLGLDEADVKRAVADGRARLAEIEAATGSDTAAGALAPLLVTDDPVAAWQAIPVEQVDRRQAVIRALFTICLDAPPRRGGRNPRPLDPDRYVVVGPPV